MTMQFKKGEKVVVLGIWDRKGTVYFKRLTVGSCGKKQMHLLKADGTLGERFNADGVNCRTFDPIANEYFDSTFVVHAEDFSEEMAMAHAAKCLAAERAHLECRIAKHPEEKHAGYRACIQKNLAALHEPRIHEVAA